MEENVATDNSGMADGEIAVGDAVTTAQPKKPRKSRYSEQASKMKELEAKSAFVLDPKKIFIMRLDGHHFSKFTRGFEKPYDVRIFDAMHKTTADLLEEFTCPFGYTQSDEITLVFPPLEKDTSLPEYKIPSNTANGKIQKLASLAAGYCTARFQVHMRAQAFTPQEAKLTEKISEAYFDARVFSVPDLAHALENLKWRQSDCKSNSRLNLGHKYLTQKETMGLKPMDVVNKLRNEKGVEWNDTLATYRFGSCFKKGQFTKEGLNPATGEHVTVSRGAYFKAAFDFNKVDQEELQRLLVCKHANEAPGLNALFSLVFPAEALFADLGDADLKKGFIDTITKYQGLDPADPNFVSVEGAKKLLAVLEDEANPKYHKLLTIFQGLNQNVPALFKSGLRLVK